MSFAGLSSSILGATGREAAARDFLVSMEARRIRHLSDIGFLSLTKVVEEYASRRTCGDKGIPLDPFFHGRARSLGREQTWHEREFTRKPSPDIPLAVRSRGHVLYVWGFPSSKFMIQLILMSWWPPSRTGEGENIPRVV
ncbi:unnamed protein product [Ectocarpus sp. 6 AP-2014]